MYETIIVRSTRDEDDGALHERLKKDAIERFKISSINLSLEDKQRMWEIMTSRGKNKLMYGEMPIFEEKTIPSIG